MRSCSTAGSNLAAVPRLLAIMGSGETSPTMSKVHRSLFERLGPAPVPAVMLDTPFGFQENADDITAKAVAYFRESVQREIAQANSAGGGWGSGATEGMRMSRAASIRTVTRRLRATER